MRTIHKYGLGASKMPGNAKIISTGIQEGEVFYWAEVDTDQPIVTRLVGATPTGGKIPEGAVHVGTILTDFGKLVWHIYDRGEIS